MTPLVSVVVTTYNHSSFIEETLASVLAQTSTDDTPVKLRRFGNDIAFLQQQNQGVAASRNAGVLRARGAAADIARRAMVAGPSRASAPSSPPPPRRARGGTCAGDGGNRMNRPVILMVLPRAPYPPDSGTAMRHHHFLAAFARIADVRLAFLYEDGSELSALEALRPYCVAAHAIPIRSTYAAARPSIGRCRRLVDHISPTPIGARASYSPELEKLLTRLASDSDLIHVARLYMVPNVSAILRSRRPEQSLLLDLDDIETIRLKRHLCVSQDPWRHRLADRLELLRLSVYQQRALRDCDRVVVCSELDQRRLNHPSVRVIPNGAPLDTGRQPLPPARNSRALLFLGTLSYRPNRDALFFFLNAIFPKILAAVPDAQLLVVGKEPAADIVQLHDGKRIIVAANVPNVHTWYAQAAAVVVPLRIGGGTRLKILEAFAFGRPVVSTTIGCGGLDVTHQEHLLIADAPSAFADACTAALTSQTLMQPLVDRAWDLVSRAYTWNSIETRIEDLATDLLGRGPRSVRPLDMTSSVYRRHEPRRSLADVPNKNIPATNQIK
jgi:glycosyltransferase involved in cell wall biosynthesis